MSIHETNIRANKKIAYEKAHNSSSSSSDTSGNANEVNRKQIEIEIEVKNLISKIIKMIKLSDGDDDDCFENDDEDDEEYDEDDDILEDLESQHSSTTKSRKSSNNNKNSYKHVKCDMGYLEEIIHKVLNVLKQSNEHGDYLSLYQNQLSSYLKEALSKYEHKSLVKSMEDILIDISDILYNELTFYSIMNTGNCLNNKPNLAQHSLFSAEASLIKTKAAKNNLNELDEKKLLIDAKLEQLKQEYKVLKEEATRRPSAADCTTTTTTETTSRSSSSSSRTESIEEGATYYFDENSMQDKLQLNKQPPANYSDILSRLKFILNEKKNEINGEMTSNSVHEAADMESNDPAVQFKLKLLKYTTDADQVGQNKCDSDTDAYIDADSDGDAKRSMDEEIKQDLAKPSQDSGEITIEDLPAKLELAVEQPGLNIQLLDRIIMESITDNLVGDENALPSLPLPLAEPEAKEEEDRAPSEDDEHEQKSESSTTSSDNFVLISSESSDQVLVENPNKPEDGNTTGSSDITLITADVCKSGDS